MKNNKFLIGILIFLILLFLVLLFMFFNKPTYNVDFISDNVVIDTISVKRNETIARPEDPQKEGYIFVNWYLDNVVYDFNSKITGNITLTAVWDIVLDEESENNFIITFNTDGGNIISPIKVEKDGKITKPDDPRKEGYKFLGWFYKLGEEEKEFDFENTVVTENITIYAKWEKIEEPKSSSQSKNSNKENTYTVTFNSNGGSNVSSQKIKENDVAKKPTNPTKSGYTFVEWRLDGKAYNFSNKVIKNITLIAVWEANPPVSSSSTNINVTGVVLSSNILNLTEGDQIKLTATVKPSNATDKTVRWTSGNPQVATVDSNGNVTAVGAGSTTITATAGGKSASCSVTVDEKITYSLYWEKIQDSSIGEYMLYIKASNGNYVSGKVRVYSVGFDDYTDYDISSNGHKFIRNAIDESRTTILSIN